MLPLASGIEVCRRPRRDPEMRDVPVIMLTARGEEDDKVRGLDRGADEYVNKTFSTEAPLADVPTQHRQARLAVGGGHLQGGEHHKTGSGKGRVRMVR